LKKQRKSLNLKAGLSGVVFAVAEEEALSGNLVCVESVSERWLIKGKYPELKNHLGKIIG